MSIANHFALPSSTTSSEQMNRQPVLRVVAGGRPTLSAREVEVLLAWLAAESKAQAADTLFITASTVNTHLTRIRAKYTAAGRPARSKANLFARAIQDGYTRLEDW
ncbi:DNA-binding transcriptional regulator, CsgD family [Williamsia maris]|uniref:DNA-binding transcriptional regulator, CsgD family n=2 Tax=Williamsia maris TaxID=72806 RepID=A0ABT1HHH9_9NOCA|nr:DNA-binding transcriptional regulator, CsgD family [Williamsia maris]